MKVKIFLFFAFFLLRAFSFGQKSKDFLVSYIDTTSGTKLIGYLTINGDTIIKAKYQFSYTDTFCRMAIVLNNNYEWIGIDRNEKTILKPFIFDNGPDYIEDGLFRVVQNNKIGFANLDGQIIIKPQFDFATPFVDGLAEYYLGGQRKYEKGDEHWYWAGSYENGYINKLGQCFKKIIKLGNNKREAWTKENKHILLNKTGQIIFTYKK